MKVHPRMNVTHQNIVDALTPLLMQIDLSHPNGGTVYIHPVPRGGIPVAYILQGMGFKFVMDLRITDSPNGCDYIVDDIIDSGKTKARFSDWNVPFIAPFVVGVNVPRGTWLTFPWEQGETNTSGEDIFTRLLQYVHEDPNRGGLVETPARALRAWEDWTDGYDKKPSDILKGFEDGAAGYNEMVLVRDIPFYSHCEHHLAPFFGTVTIGYVPNIRVVGLSKLSRLVDIFAHRLQVQERMTVQITHALAEELDCCGVGVVVKARHLCMESRGIRKQGHETVTSKLQGVMFTKPEARSEFLLLARG